MYFRKPNEIKSFLTCRRFIHFQIMGRKFDLKFHFYLIYISFQFLGQKSVLSSYCWAFCKLGITLTKYFKQLKQCVNHTSQEIRNFQQKCKKSAKFRSTRKNSKRFKKKQENMEHERHLEDDQRRNGKNEEYENN